MWKPWLKHTVACTLFIYLMMAGIYYIPSQLEVIRPVSLALADLEMTDIVFSKLRDENPPADTNIVLVNSGTLDRAQLATLVRVIQSGDPQTIALAVDLSQPESPETDSTLSESLSEVDNLILASQLYRDDPYSETFDSVAFPLKNFRFTGKIGFSNVEGDDQRHLKTSRRYLAYESVKGRLQVSMATLIAREYDPEATREFEALKTNRMLINYTRPQSSYVQLDAGDVLNPMLEFSFKNKLIIIGYLGQYLGDPDHTGKLFTPMNEKYAGKSAPDMHRPVVLANIVSMIHERNLITETPIWVDLGLDVLLLVLNVGLFLFINQRMPAYYDLLTKSLQVVEILLILFLTVQVLYKYDLKINLTLAIASLLLAGDLLEVYVGLVLNFIRPYLKKFVPLFQISQTHES